VYFYETDAAGIVHFSNYLRYLEEAEHALWRENGLSIAARDARVGWPRVAVSFDYRRPLRFEDEFEIHLRVEDVSQRTMRYACRIECRGELVAEGGMTIVCVEKQPDHTMRAVAIPEEIKAAFTPPASAEGYGGQAAEGSGGQAS
jgi:acyl-CoA thioester hydrolase